MSRWTTHIDIKRSQRSQTKNPDRAAYQQNDLGKGDSKDISHLTDIPNIFYNISDIARLRVLSLPARNPEPPKRRQWKHLYANIISLISKNNKIIFPRNTILDVKQLCYITCYANESNATDRLNVLNIWIVAHGTLTNNTTRQQSLLGSLSAFPGSETHRIRAAPVTPAILDADIAHLVPRF